MALITATTLALAGLSTSCKQTPTPTPKHEVAFGVEGGQSQGGQSGQGTAGGTLTAKADGVPETSTSPITVEEGKTVTFTAKANDGYRVKGWTLDGKPIAEAGTNTEYKLKVSKPATVKVSFLAGAAAYTVKHYQERAEGGYPLEPTESETLNGTVDGEASYTAKTYEGFTQKADFTKINGRLTQTGTVLADGNTVVELFYERNTVSLTFRLAGGNIEGKTDDIVKTGKYGTPFTAPVPAKATGVFKGWKPALPSPLLFPAKDAEHTAEWTPKAFLTLEAGKNTVKVKAKTADGKPITVEGCSVNELANEAETTLTVTDPERKLALIGDIIELDCSGEETPGGNRPLIALDASGLTALQKLDCDWNQLTALNVQGLKALQELNCNTNQIPELNVQGLTKLQQLKCGGNQLTALNVSGCTALKELDCNSNELATLDVQGCTALSKLNCGYNQLKTLNVSDCVVLKELDCSDNQLTTLNVQGLTALKELNCDENQLSTLNVQGCSSLKRLTCYKNKLNADAFIKLFNDLPTREGSDNAEAILYAEPDAYNPQANEGNCTDFTQPASLKAAFDNAKDAKHWAMKKLNGVGFDEDI